MRGVVADGDGRGAFFDEPTGQLDPPKPLAPAVLAVDISASKFSAGLVTTKGELADRSIALVDPDVGPEAHFRRLTTIVEQQMELADRHELRVAAVGIGCTGPIGPNCETVSPAGIPSWREFPLRERIEELTAVRVYGDLDGKAMVMAEGWKGAAQGLANYCVMSVSTTIGAGIVLDGEVIDGASGNAGQIGHIIVEPNGRRCGCGARGCLEAEASGLAIEAITGRSPTEPTYEIMQRTGRLVGRAAATLCNLLDLDRRALPSSSVRCSYLSRHRRKAATLPRSLRSRPIPCRTPRPSRWSWAARSRRIACALLSTCLLACATERSHVDDGARTGDVDVAAALEAAARHDDPGLEAEDIAVIAFPRTRRPCCVLGVDLKVALGRIPVPGVDLGNVVDPGEIGPHHYYNGYLSLRVIGTENNGLVYTCRGGFIDVAHVRDNADNTIALVSAFSRAMETGTTIDLRAQGATRRIVMRPFEDETIRRHGRLPLAIAAAQWTAFQIAIWHEIATFYGYGSVADWEKISAFSPEDLYSNLVGERLAGAIAVARGARSELEYDASMDASIRQALDLLEVVPVDETRAALQAVDGAWWDSQKRIPDWTLVRRRHFETTPAVRPWTLEDARPGSKGPVEPLARCRDAGDPMVLEVADGFAGLAFRDHLTTEFEVGHALVRAGFPLPRPGSRRVTQDDFPGIVSAIREENAKAFGVGADAP